jgi:hypothetical protein
MNCEYCNTEFKTKSSLNIHKIKAKYCLILQGKLDKKEIIFKCDFCEKVLSSKQCLEIHKEKCKGKKEDIFKCEYCNKILSSKQNLDIHVKKCVIIDEKEEFKCEFCKKNLSTRQKLEYHKNICNSKKQKEEKETKETLKRKDKELKEKDKVIIKIKTQNESFKEQLEKQEKSFKEQLEKQEKNYKEQIKDLQNKLDKIANKAVDKPTTTNNNTTNNTLNITSHINFNDIERIQNIINDKLTINDVITGQKGIAMFTKQHILTDEEGKLSYMCTDPSRYIFKFKDEDGDVKKDIETKKLTEYLIVGGIKAKSVDIGNDWCKDENGNIDMTKFNIIMVPQQSILKLKDDNNVFKKELASLTSL